jgi:hypothetical protein
MNNNIKKFKNMNQILRNVKTYRQSKICDLLFLIWDRMLVTRLLFEIRFTMIYI